MITIYKRIVYKKLRELVKWRLFFGFQTNMATPCCRVFSLFLYLEIFLICKHGLDLDLSSTVGQGPTFVNILWWLNNERNISSPQA